MNRYVNTVARQFLVRTSYLAKGQIVVNEFPKSGATWLCFMLSDVSGTYFPRLKYPAYGANLLQGHYLHQFGISNPVIIWRDPRDVLISHFHHVTTYRQGTSSENTKRVRNLLGIDENDEAPELNKYFIAYIELMHNASIHPYYSLHNFYNNWFDKNSCIHTSYELMRKDTEMELNRIIESSNGRMSVKNSISDVVEKYSFENMSGRKPGDENTENHLRKGVVGDWRNSFSPMIENAVMKRFKEPIEMFESSDLSVKL